MPSLSKYQKALICVFVLCFSYWTYLIFDSHMGVRFDAESYERLGSMIYKKGWLEYFRTGPNREPLYPFLISVSMRIADVLSVPYYYIQKIFQVLILFLTQILMLIFLDKLKIHEVIKLMTVLYLGLSPAIVNSAMSLFSEIATYPFVLLAILCSVLSWQAVFCKKKKQVMFLGLITALSFLLATFNKGIFQYVFLTCLVPFVGIAVDALLKNKKKIFVNSLLYVIAALIVFQSGIGSFKFMNKKYNGHFAFTDRVSGLFYGNAHKRTNKLTPRLFGAHIASIPGEGTCRRFFTEEECWYCGFQAADHFRSASYLGQYANVPEQEGKKEVFSLAFERIKTRPFQYLLLMGMEAFKMPFWESTQIGFVGYPPWLGKLFATGWFKDGLRLSVSLATIFSLIFLACNTWQKKVFLFESSAQSEEIQICFFSLLVILSFTGLYALFSIVTRYALLIVPIYLVANAYCVHNMMHRLSQRKQG